jgi:hypothetical protein
MTVTSRTAKMLATGLLGAAASVLIAVPVANAQCTTTVGQSASQTVQTYLDEHPSVKAELTAKSQAEGSGTNLIDYLNRHPDVRQALITLANQCTS